MRHKANRSRRKPIVSEWTKDMSGHAHEQRDAFYPDPILPRSAVSEVRRFTRGALEPYPGATESIMEALSDFERRLDELNLLAALARQAFIGDTEAARAFNDWVTQISRAGSRRRSVDAAGAGDEPDVPDHRDTRHNERDERPGAHVGGRVALMPINLVPVLDLFVGAAWVTAVNGSQLEAALRGVDAAVRPLLAFGLALERAARSFRLRPAGEVGLRDFLWELRLDPPGPSLPGELELCLGTVHDVLGPGGALDQALQLMQPDPNTYRIWKVEPNSVCAGGEVTVLSSPRDRFDATPPDQVVAYFPPCARGKIVDWTAKAIHVSVPDTAISGARRCPGMTRSDTRGTTAGRAFITTRLLRSRSRRSGQPGSEGRWSRTQD